jgi:hypothetical protein
MKIHSVSVSRGVVFRGVIQDADEKKSFISHTAEVPPRRATNGSFFSLIKKSEPNDFSRPRLERSSEI